jgi:RNA polymerase sigma factor (sigma-70 family)
VQAYADSAVVHDVARDLEFERIYRRHVRDVYRYTLAVLRNPADAEDITQTTFLNAYRAYLRGEEPLKPRHWLIKIAHNACLSRHLRAVRRPQEVPLEETIAAVRVPPEEATKVEDLLAALGKLPFNQRSALVMRELEGRSYVEIAETLEVSVAAVETLIFRARRTLRRDRSLTGALSAVQLPPSLTSLFAGGSGGVVAGGGAVAGSGVLFKVLMVVTAGVVAGTVGTGVDKVLADNARPPASAALQVERPGVIVGSGWTVVGGPAGAGGPIVIVRQGTRTVVVGGAFGTAAAARLVGGYRNGGAGVVSPANGKAGPAFGVPLVDAQAAGAAGVARSDAPPAGAVASVPVPSAAAPTTSAPPVTDTVSDATSTATSDTTSSLPVSVPTAPEVPATPPPPAALPAVPAPAIPAVPTPDVPELPAPPDLP